MLMVGLLAVLVAVPWKGRHRPARPIEQEPIVGLQAGKGDGRRRLSVPVERQEPLTYAEWQGLARPLPNRTVMNSSLRTGLSWSAPKVVSPMRNWQPSTARSISVITCCEQRRLQ